MGVCTKERKHARLLVYFFLKKNDFWLSELELGTVDKKGCDKPEVREKYVGFLCYCLLYHFTTARRKSGGSYRRSYFFFAPVDFTTVQDPSRDSKRETLVCIINTAMRLPISSSLLLSPLQLQLYHSTGPVSRFISSFLGLGGVRS